MKAADIRDDYVLRSIRRNRTAIGASIYSVFADLPDFPEKVVRAKLHALLRRQAITGCVCGCRGDFNLTSKGKDLLEDQ